MRLLVVTVVNKYTIAKLDRLSLGNCIAAILVGIVKEEAKPERIRSKQSVATSVPVGRMTKAFRAIEDSDPRGVSIDGTRNIDPVGALTPNLGLPGATFGIDHRPCGRVQFGSKTKG